MKKTLLVLLLAVVSVTTFAQTGKVAYVYSEKIFKSMTEYDAAVKEIEQYAKYGNDMSKAKLAEVETMFKDFRKIESSLSSSSKTIHKNEIIAKEKEANSYQENFFKEGGQFETKQKEIMKPIEQKVLDAVNSVAAEGNYDMIFDLSTSKSTIYQKPTLDLTQTVIAKIKK